MASKTLLKGGTVLTLGAKTPNFTEADVLIDDGRVAEVGQGLRARDAEMVDASDAIVMPGFVDTHRHVWKSLFRNLGDTAVLGSHYQPDDIYAATLIGLLVQLRRESPRLSTGQTSTPARTTSMLHSRPTPTPGCARFSSTPPEILPTLLWRSSPH